MPAYPSGAGSNIGTLLRLIQEDQNKSIASTPPSADPDSPLRGVIQQPIEAPSSPGSERVVSIRPEGAIQSGPDGGVVAPVAPVTPAGPAVQPGIVAPSRPAAPAFSGVDGGGGSVSAPGGGPSSSPSLSNLSPRIGTSIRPSANFTAQVPNNTPLRKATPSRSFNQPSTSKSGGSQGAFGGTVGESLLGAVQRFAPQVLRGLGTALARFPIFLTKPQADIIKLQNSKGFKT